MQTVKINPNDLYQAGTEPDVIPTQTAVENLISIIDAAGLGTPQSANVFFAGPTADNKMALPTWRILDITDFSADLLISLSSALNAGSYQPGINYTNPQGLVF